MNLLRALSKEFGECVCKLDGTPTWKGSGASGERSDVLKKLLQITRHPNVSVILLTVHKPGIVYAYAPPPQKSTLSLGEDSSQEEGEVSLICDTNSG